jgi:hypothetical protein
MSALFVREFEKDLLAFRVLELVAVSLEEAIGPALALDPDHERLTIVHAVRQSIGCRGKEPVSGSLEEEKRGPRFELRILLQQLPVSLLQRGEMVLLLRRELFEHPPSARVAADGRRA